MRNNNRRKLNVMRAGVVIGTVVGALVVPSAVSAAPWNDWDWDGLPNNYERNVTHTNPLRWDSDRDRVAGLLQPFADRRFGDAFAQRGDFDFGRHNDCPVFLVPSPLQGRGSEACPPMGWTSAAGRGVSSLSRRVPPSNFG